MKITKYPQSCLKIEKDGRTILIDPGSLATAEFSWSQFGSVDAVLFTHSHIDHFDPKLLPEIGASGASVYGNSNVAQLAEGVRMEVIDEGEELVVVGFKVKAYGMEHCLMTDGTPAGIPNTGFLIDNRVLHPGDSTEDVGVKAEIVAAPIFGPDISFKDAYDLLKTTEAKRAIPVHYDVSSMDPASFGRFSAMGGQPSFKVVALGNGESASCSP